MKSALKYITMSKIFKLSQKLLRLTENDFHVDNSEFYRKCDGLMVNYVTVLICKCWVDYDCNLSCHITMILML